MPSRLPNSPVPEVYTAREVARAAGVAARHVAQLVDTGHVYSANGFIPEAAAIRLVRQLTGRSPAAAGDKMPLTLVPRTRRTRGGMSFVTSTLLHGTLVLLLALASTFGWLAAQDTEATVTRDKPVRLVFLNLPGPGGGGGGGGLKAPLPPPPARQKSPEPKPVASPVPPVRRVAAPPRPRPRPRPPVVTPPPQPRPVETPLPTLEVPQAIEAPVQPIAGDEVELAGLPDPPVAAATDQPSAGPGSGGGIGSGLGVGLGEGDGGGIGSGSGGGTGGGPYQPGSGIEPPTLVREVRASYTADARRQAIEGDVVLEVVVRRDGKVGNVRVMRGLGAGLDQKAIDAVRQWRFTPARRQGAPVDVVVTVSVEFTLR